ncbi:MAG TPA: hypothetical protein VD996_02610 [Chitinophagaceae bacterium]|nr:hypothetical protein [Chitinophagaceae bacterium]
MKAFMPELDPDLRLQALKDNCDSKEETEYYKDLTQADLDIKMEALSRNLIFLSEREDELQAIKDEFKMRMAGPKQENKELLQQIKTRKEKVIGTLYHLANLDEGIMETYDERGEFVSSRRLRPGERQSKLFPLRKAANE